MNVHLWELAAKQQDLVAAWQLLAAGWTRAMIEHHAEQQRWRVVHAGVYALTHAPLTRSQCWKAATLTTPDSVLSHASAGARWGFWRFDGRFEVITRPGSGGPKQIGSLLVCRSKTIDATIRDGIPITTAARTLIDLAALTHPKATRRAFREALRLKVTTRDEIRGTLARHRGRRGTALVRELCERYGTVPYERTRSDAEGRALEVLHDAGVEAPRVNVKIAGYEADLVWPGRKEIVEIDGPQYHQFAEEDARKQRAWEDAGYVVRRLPSDAVYEGLGLVQDQEEHDAHGRQGHDHEGEDRGLDARGRRAAH